MAPITETADGEVVVTPSHMSDETRRLGRAIYDGLQFGAHAGEDCRICGHVLSFADLRGDAQIADVGPNGEVRLAHRQCWKSFVELLQTMPPQRLYELISETGTEAGKENNGQQQAIERGAK